jgi:hypothetical protein
MDYMIQMNYEAVFNNINDSIPMGELTSECLTDIQHIQKAISYSVYGKNDTFKSQVMPGCKLIIQILIIKF